METQLANQIARALVIDGVCKLTQDQIVEALLPVYVDGFRFGGVARERTSPGKVSRLTIFATAADGVYRAFSGHSVLYDQIVLFASEDGARWTKWIIYDGGRGAVDYPINPLAVHLTFTAEEAAVLSFYRTSSGPELQVEVSTDDGKTWEAKTASTAGTPLADLQPGRKVLVRGNNPVYNETYFRATGKMAASGNIMSLTDAENFATADTLANSAFKKLFNNRTAQNTWLTSAPLLPAMTVGSECYLSMFGSCKSLTKAPELPATTLAASCYEMMFQDSGIEVPSELPATTLAERCYYSMFIQCAHLKTAPKLPATQLANYCYSSMFDSCAALTQAPELPATTLAENCYYSMFARCTALVKAPELPAPILVYRCYSNMFTSCENLQESPILAFDNFVYNSCNSMFSSCISLVRVTCYASNPQNSSPSSWLTGVAAAGTFVKKAGVTWPTGDSGIPTGWTVEEV